MNGGEGTQQDKPPRDMNQIWIRVRYAGCSSVGSRLWQMAVCVVFYCCWLSLINDARKRFNHGVTFTTTSTTATIVQNR